MIKDSYIRYQVGWKWERSHNQIKACFRFIGKSKYCVFYLHILAVQVSPMLLPPSSQPLITETRQSFQHFHHKLQARGHMTRSPASLPPFQPIFNSQMLHVRAGLPLGGHVICVAYGPKQTNEVQSQVTSYYIKQLVPLLHVKWCTRAIISCLLFSHFKISITHTHFGPLCIWKWVTAPLHLKNTLDIKIIITITIAIHFIIILVQHF